MKNAPEIALSTGTLARIGQLFAAAEQPVVFQLLTEECGANLPMMEDATPESLERIRFAALKLSGGDLARLFDVIRLAQVDWRDVLLAAGFADDLRAHERWWPVGPPN
ncbi:MAG TPA: hypothetical protein VHM19_00600 [Polyangiales bacterium]|nr:hypothetical protein [Polyangiales bacterium]